MRFGGPVFINSKDPYELAQAHQAAGYRAAFCPDYLNSANFSGIEETKKAYAKHDLIIAEVGAWCNVLTQDKEEAKKNIKNVQERLALADELEAKCCVNIVGTWYDKNWYGPCAENFSSDFFDYAVEVSRKIIDGVKPRRTKMSFELMPFSFLDSAQEYLRFIEALDRKEAGIHFDPINCINSPRVYYDNKKIISESFNLLGDKIVSIHLKDIILRTEPVSVILEEVPIGTGGIDYVNILKCINRLDPEIPAMLEHLPDEKTYMAAAESVRKFAIEAELEM